MHGRGGHAGVVFFDAAHHGAQVHGFDDDGNALWVEQVAQEVGYLARHALLDLQAAGVHVDDAGNFGEAEHPAVWNVGNVSAPNEGQHVMFAKAIEFDIAYDDHFIVLDFEDGVVDESFCIDVVACEEFSIHTGHAGGGFLQAFSCGVFAKSGEHAEDGFFDGWEVDVFLPIWLKDGIVEVVLTHWVLQKNRLAAEGQLIVMQEEIFSGQMAR